MSMEKIEVAITQGVSQSTSNSPGTRRNSERLWVTSVEPVAKAMAAISRSYGPNRSPLRFQLMADTGENIGGDLVEWQATKRSGKLIDIRSILDRFRTSQYAVIQLRQDHRTQANFVRWVGRQLLSNQQVLSTQILHANIRVEQKHQSNSTGFGSSP